MPTSPVSLFGLDPATYTPHRLHEPGQLYPQTNCYLDVVVELLHGGGYEPLALMSCVFLLDFEGDQFTFFKPEPHLVRQLFGIEIHEMQPYRPLPEQIAEQLAAGRTLIVEADSWFLPDTDGTSYRHEHVKSSIAPEWIDLDAQQAHYFHNGGLYAVEGDDYRGALRVDVAAGDERLPPYTELVRFDAGAALTGAELREAARAELRSVLARRSTRDPFAAYAERLGRELDLLVGGEPADMAAHVFATARMAGSAAAVGANHAEWLFGAAGADVTAALTEVAQACTTLSFKLSRRRAFDPNPLLTGAGEQWATALSRLGELAG